MANDPDIKLLFGVEGGASIDQGSGKQIFDNLKEIVKSINSKDVLKVKVGLDDGSAKEFKEQIKGVMSGADTGVEVKITGLDKTASDADKVSKALDGVAASAKKAGQAAKESSGEALAKGTREYNDALTKINNMLIQLRNNSRNWTAAAGGKGFVDLSRIEGQITLLEGLEKKLEKGDLSAEDFVDEMSRIRAVATDAAESINKFGENHSAVEVLVEDTKEYNDALTKSYTLLGQIYSNQSSWTKAATGTSADKYASLGTSANDLSDLIEMLKTGSLDVQTFAELFSDIRENVTEAGTAIKAAGENMKAVVSPETTARLAQVNAELKEIAVQNSTLTSQYRKITAQDSIEGINTSQVDLLKTKYQDLLKQTELLRVNRKSATDDDINGVRQLQAEVQRLVAEINRQAEAAKKAASVDKEEKKEQMASLKEVIALYEQIDKYLLKNSRAKGTEQYESLKKIRDELHAVKQAGDAAGEGLASISKVNFKSKSGEVRNLESSLRDAGKEGRTLAEIISAAYQKFGGWMFITQSLTKIVSGFKQMVEEVKQVDSAMTELKKVTDETDASYERFLTNASIRSRELGASLSDVVLATADFSRLGFSIEDASSIADAVIVYKNVGDGINDISEASESLISTMQAFGVNASDIMSIVDKFNNVGNRYAISSKGVGDALLDSASAMKAAGNSLDESIALITAANTTIQNPDKVGTALRSVSMYIRAAKEEAENAGIATDGMASSVSELREQIFSLTKGEVDIMISDTEFKSTYQIIKEISKVWDSLEGTDQSLVSELLGGGVRNFNIVSALIRNFQIAEDSLTDSINSAGSALAENEVYLDSIAGKSAQFQAAWQALSTTVIDSGLVKGTIDFGTALLNAANNIAEFLGGIGAVSIAVPAVITAFNKFKVIQDVFHGIIDAGKNLAGGAKRCPHEYARHTVMVTSNERLMP